MQRDHEQDCGDASVGGQRSAQRANKLHEFRYDENVWEQSNTIQHSANARLRRHRGTAYHVENYIKNKGSAYHA